MTLSRTLLRRLRRMAIPGLTVSAALGLAVTLFSHNTVTLNWLNNWFNNWFNKTINIGSITITLETSPDASEPVAQPDIRVEPVVRINLPEIAFNPEIVVDTEVNPQISVDTAAPINIELTEELQPPNPPPSRNQFNPSFAPTFAPTFDPKLNFDNTNQVDLNRLDLQSQTAQEAIRIELAAESAVRIEEQIRAELAQWTIPTPRSPGAMEMILPEPNAGTLSAEESSVSDQVDPQREEMGSGMRDRNQPESQSGEVTAQSPSSLPENNPQHTDVVDLPTQEHPEPPPVDVSEELPQPMAIASPLSPSPIENQPIENLSDSEQPLPTDSELSGGAEPTFNSNRVRFLQSEPSVIAFADEDTSQELPESPLQAGLALIGLAFWLPRWRRQMRKRS